MKSLLIAAALLLATTCAVNAQTNDSYHADAVPPTPTESNFSMPQDWVNIRDYIHLPGKARLIVELTNTDQYAELKGIDTLLTALMRDIAFYRDSIAAGAGSVRIDYAIDDEFSVRKMRFKNHPADGQAFVNTAGGKAKLKIDQDTVRIYVRRYPLYAGAEKIRGWVKKSNYMRTHAAFYQLTFCVNSYEDIAKIAADRATLQHALDTMAATKKESTKADPYKFPSSARFNPYATQNDVKAKWQAPADVRFKQYGGLLRSESARNWSVISRSDQLSLDANIGAGLLRNTIAPYAEIGLYIAKQSRRPYKDEYRKSTFGLNLSSYFTFPQNASGEYTTRSTMFLSAQYAETPELSAGIGYMLPQKTGYFTGTTMKFYFGVSLLRTGLTLTPEIIVTNNFKQVFPGLTLKVF